MNAREGDHDHDSKAYLTRRARRKIVASPPNYSPPRRTCGTMQVHLRLLEHASGIPAAAGRDRAGDVTAARERQDVATGSSRFRSSCTSSTRPPPRTSRTPRCFSQIHGLNRNYRRRNFDWVKTPTYGEDLASTRESASNSRARIPGGTATNGITRTQTTQTSFADDDGVKFTAKGGIDAWPSDRYLNLWVCALGGGLLGYAQFPGGPAATDGVVILQHRFGKTRKRRGTLRSRAHRRPRGRPLAQPPSHLGRHVTDCSGTDYVADTPNAQHPNYGKPTFPHISCGNGPNGDMFMNFMDYVDDDTMVMFTAGPGRAHARDARRTSRLDRKIAVQIEQENLLGRWVHSHEEDRAGEMVFRRPAYAFPPSRGRRSFDLAADGSLVESGPGPTDRTQQSHGNWKLQGDELTVSGAGSPEKFKIAAADPQTLVLRQVGG